MDADKGSWTSIFLCGKSGDEDGAERDLFSKDCGGGVAEWHGEESSPCNEVGGVDERGDEERGLG